MFPSHESRSGSEEREYKCKQYNDCGVVLLLALILSISFYHGLTTDKFTAPSGTRESFDYPGYVRMLGSEGVERTRVFAELPWLWKLDTNQKLRPAFNARFSVFPFVYLPDKKKWDFSQRNAEFTSRIESGGKIAEEYGMDILICFATQGPEFGCPYFFKMGYEKQSSSYYSNANNSFYRNSGAWNRFLDHYRAIAAATRGNARQYRFYEPFNEQKSVAVTSELRAIQRSIRSARDKYKMQMNVPNPLFPVPGFSNISQYLAALRGLLSGRDGIQPKRLAFHGIFTAEGVRELARLLKSGGISPRICEISTDGATPWKGRFTERAHNGHQNARLVWKESASSVRAVIDAHVEIVRAAKQEGFAVCDIQDVIKWAGDLNPNAEVIRQFHREVVHAAR